MKSTYPWAKGVSDDFMVLRTTGNLLLIDGSNSSPRQERREFLLVIKPLLLWNSR